MARRLGMNPNKLPGLRATPQQRWKLPVERSSVECYRKRFGSDAHDHDPHVPEPGSRKHAHAAERLRNAGQLGDLVCYLITLADDRQKWLAGHGGWRNPNEGERGTAGDRAGARHRSAEPFHVSAVISFDWDPVDAARSYTGEEDLLTEVVGRRRRPLRTERRWTRIDLSLHASLPCGSATSMPEPDVFLDCGNTQGGQERQRAVFLLRRYESASEHGEELGPRVSGKCSRQPIQPSQVDTRIGSATRLRSLSF